MKPPANRRSDVGYAAGSRRWIFSQIWSAQEIEKSSRARTPLKRMKRRPVLCHTGPVNPSAATENIGYALNSVAQEIRERREAPFFVAIRWHLVHDEVRGGEYHEGRIGGLTMEVRVSALLRDLLGAMGFAKAVCKWGRQNRWSSESYLSGWKSNVNDLVGDIVF
jgi:hypothetical protein